VCQKEWLAWYKSAHFSQFAIQHLTPQPRGVYFSTTLFSRVSCHFFFFFFFFLPPWIPPLHILCTSTYLLLNTCTRYYSEYETNPIPNEISVNRTHCCLHSCIPVTNQNRANNTCVLCRHWSRAHDIQHQFISFVNTVTHLCFDVRGTLYGVPRAWVGQDPRIPNF
jgi:hypothetical protein